jgi:hypothetical protein
MNVKEVVGDAVDSWRKRNTPDVIRRRVRDVLNSRRDELIIKLAGFDNKWGRWELDHTNGRASTMDMYIREVAGNAVREWVRHSIQDLPIMTTEMQAALKMEYEDRFEREVRHRIVLLAQERANRAMDEMLDISIDVAAITWDEPEPSPAWWEE